MRKGIRNDHQLSSLPFGLYYHGGILPHNQKSSNQMAGSTVRKSRLVYGY